MANRYTLHKTKLEDFKDYLNAHGIAYRQGRGDYQILQVQTKDGWQCIYERGHMPEHYTVQDKLMSLVGNYLKNKREKAEDNEADIQSKGRQIIDFTTDAMREKNEEVIKELWQAIDDYRTIKREG